MHSPFDRVSAAWFPQDQLKFLAGARCRSDVSVYLSGERAWVTWPAGNEEVWQALLPTPDCEFYEERDGLWFQLGHRLPQAGFPPKGEAKKLDAILFPAPAHAQLPVTRALAPVHLQLVVADEVRPTAAMRCSLADLQPWADQATTKQLADCQAACCDDHVILRGPHLPPVPGADRFWGSRVWIPLGMRPKPNLPETALRAAAEVSLGEILLLTPQGAEAIPEDAFAMVTRAGLRLVQRR
jgi:MoxR-vWA-beta-propeller ternary system domain bpX2